ncbi:MAG: ZIP family metal transporter [Ignavibacteria bacterium]|nr:ZIP family metal transporter [Ignavibacteria bacterium]MBI3766247.1 ZIP family metal transporter [Ignavibacteriales bacterium]
MLSIVLFGLIAAAAEILGGTLVILRKEWPRKVQEYLIALSAGFLLALVFFELMPESFALLGHAAPLYIIIGFGMLHFFEHTIVGHLHFGEEIHHEVMVSKVASFSAFGGLFVHAFFDGISISAGMQFNFHIGLLIFFAILLHKIPEGLTIASIMLAASQPRKNAFIASFAIGAATMLGIMIVFLLATVDAKAIGIAFAFSAGAATYVGASDLIPEINRSDNRITPLIVFGGMLLFYLSQQYLKMFVVTGM